MCNSETKPQPTSPTLILVIASLPIILPSRQDLA
jgi:hypothetical protein